MAESEREEANVTDDLALDLIRMIRRESRPASPLPTNYPLFDNIQKPVHALLFDVYGTLFVSASGDISLHSARTARADDGATDSEEGPIAGALRAAGCTLLDPAAVEQVGQTEYFAVIEGIHAEKRELGIEYPEVDIVHVWAQILDELSGSGLIRSPGNATTPYLASLAYECRTNPVWPMPGAREVLALLSAAELPVGLISNAQFFTPLLFPALFEKPLPELGIDEGLCTWSFQRGIGKPSPRLYEAAADLLFRRHAVPPENVLYVGNDLLNDIMPAKQVGFSACLYAGDARSLRLREEDPRCAHVRADAAIGSLEQLPKLLRLPSTAQKEHR